MTSKPTNLLKTSLPGSSTAKRDALRRVLQQWEPAAGPSGFEGLITRALANLTGYTFRLARSGAQFGRDAATPNAPFSIAMEAKRYKDSVPLQELVGKAALAAFELAEGIDLWVLAATVEVSEPTERKLAEVLATGGISLLTLDWTDTGLPPIAVLLACERTEVLPWAKGLLSFVDYAALRDGLDDIAADPVFQDAHNKLVEALSPAHIGLDALRQRNAAWYEQHFSDRKLAQRVFSQFINPLQKPSHSVARPSIDKQIADAVELARHDPEGDSLVAVLGTEGSGKSWAVARWWYASSPRPILFLSAGRMANLLTADDEPLDVLARLAAAQDGGLSEAVVTRWRRRLARWSIGINPRNRFAIVIDGLNETSGKPWSSILRSLLPAAQKLGGTIIITCRDSYWKREIEPRLPIVTFHKVSVGGYNDEEFADLLNKNQIRHEKLSSRLNSFMRNPRICALALSIRSQLTNLDDLSVDRLLLEYWRARLLERGDLVGHDEIDFRDLLMRHARDYRERPGINFSRNEWLSRSGAASRADGRNLTNDLSDIEEGRFFDPARGTYRFREETLSFALGLLLADEVRSALQAPGPDAGQAIAAAIDPIRGFDTAADIITSAIAIATLDEDYPDAGISQLMACWLSLQNLTDGAFQALVTYVATRPEAFLDAFEHRDGNSDDGRFLQLLLVSGQRPSVSDAIASRINRWLGTWSRSFDDWGNAQEQQRRRDARDRSITERLARLTASEQIYFQRNCPEFPDVPRVAGAAALFLCGLEQAPFAVGIVAFAFAHTIAGTDPKVLNDLAWVMRLNRSDFEALSHAVHAEIAPFKSPTASETARQAAALALSLLGSLSASHEAEALRPPAFNAQRDDPVDPLDPAAQQPANFTRVADVVGNLAPNAIWTEMSTTAEDHDLDRNLNLLARFDPESLVAFLDRVSATVSTRTGMSLRQLGWHFPWLSPIVSDDTVLAVTRRIEAIVQDPRLLPAGDGEFVTGMMVEGALPRLDAEAQLDLLQSLPPEAPFLMRYSNVAKPLLPQTIERRLHEAMSLHPRVLERTLLFLAANAGPVSEHVRRDLMTCLVSLDIEVRAAAADFVRRSGDRTLDEALVAVALPDDNDDSWRGSVIRTAIASAIGRLGRDDLIDCVPVEHLDWVAVRLPAARGRLADVLEAAVRRLVQPIATDEPSDVVIVLEVDEDPARTLVNLVDKQENTEVPIASLSAESDDPEDDSFTRRQRLLNEQLQLFLSSLVNENALMVAKPPYRIGLQELAREDPGRYAGWLQAILTVEDPHTLRNLQNLGFALAQNFTAFDAALSARVLAHLWKVPPHVTVQIGPAKHAIRDIALFASSSSPEIDALRSLVFEEACNDAHIERLVVAAEAADANAWLDNFIEHRLLSSYASDQALAITAASFRPKNLQSDDVLGRDWASGFVGNAARVGRLRYVRAQHAAHWFEQAASANSPRERWRFLELGIAAADRRQALVTHSQLQLGLREMGGDVPRRLSQSIDKASKANAKTLFGMQKPSGLLARLVSP